MSETRDSRDSRKKIGVALTQMYENGNVRVFLKGYEVSLEEVGTGDSLIGIFEGVRTDERGKLLEIYMTLSEVGKPNRIISVDAERVKGIRLLCRDKNNPIPVSKECFL